MCIFIIVPFFSLLVGLKNLLYLIFIFVDIWNEAPIFVAICPTNLLDLHKLGSNVVICCQLQFPKRNSGLV